MLRSIKKALFPSHEQKMSWQEKRQEKERKKLELERARMKVRQTKTLRKKVSKQYKPKTKGKGKTAKAVLKWMEGMGSKYGSSSDPFGLSYPPTKRRRRSRGKVK